MHREERSGTRLRNMAQRIGLGSTTAVLAVVAVMALAPATSAATAHPSSIVPVKIFGASLSTGTQQGACGSAKILKAPSWTDKSHKFRGSISASSPACKPSQSANEGIADVELLLTTTKLTFPVSGNLVMNLSWAFKVSEAWNMTPYSACKINYADPSSMCFSYVEDTLYTQPILFDESNGTWGPYGAGLAFSSAVDIYTSSFAYVENASCAGCNYSYGTPGPGSFSGVINGTNTFNLTGTSSINKADHFELEVIVLIQSITEAYAIDAKTRGSASASASINASSGGNGVLLRGITIT